MSDKLAIALLQAATDTVRAFIIASMIYWIVRFAVQAELDKWERGEDEDATRKRGE